MMTLKDVLSQIDARLSEKPFASLDDLLGSGWSEGLSFRGYAPNYKAAAIERAARMQADGTTFGA